MNKKAWIVLADGFEEIEAITPIDVLRRAEVEVTIMGLDSLQIKGAHGIEIQCDEVLKNTLELPDVIVLPGGMPGASNLSSNQTLQTLLLSMDKEKRFIAAICASPAVVLSPLKILDNRKATCYPGFESQFSSLVCSEDSKTVVDQHIITSRGPGTALDFSYQIVAQLLNVQCADELVGQMQAH